MTSSAPGRLIALEGIDGSGKSTQAARLATSLDAVLTVEPGGTPTGQALRAIVLDAPGPLDPRAEALLMAADRAQHVEAVILPALRAGRWVVTDRYTASTLAYQGYGRGIEREVLDQLIEFATGGLGADLSILLDVPVAAALARRAGSEPDRLERLGAPFAQRVRDGYRALAVAEPDRWAVVDATGTVDEVARAVADVVADRLGSPGPHR